MKKVLINGGSRGIGRAMVEYFTAIGDSVAFTYKNACNEAKELSERTGALAICADSGSEEDVVRAVVQTISTLGGIDCLINNAAISSFSLFTDLTLAEWEHIFRINVTGAFLYSREAARYMVKQKNGVIINISSVWGLTGSSCEVHYCATKSALIGMTKALAKELGPSGIRVNAVAPGVIDTEMNAALSAEDMAALREETPMGRIGNAQEIARAVGYLCSEDASFITGEVLNISGGFVI